MFPNSQPSLKVYSKKIKVGFPSLNNVFNVQCSHLSNFCDFIEIYFIATNKKPMVALEKTNNYRIYIVIKYGLYPGVMFKIFNN